MESSTTHFDLEIQTLGCCSSTHGTNGQKVRSSNQTSIVVMLVSKRWLPQSSVSLCPVELRRHLVSPKSFNTARSGASTREMRIRNQTPSVNGMRGISERATALYRTPTGRKMFRYTLVSVISTAVYLAVLILVFGFLHLWSEVPEMSYSQVRWPQFLRTF